MDSIPEYGTQLWIERQNKYEGWDHYHDDGPVDEFG